MNGDESVGLWRMVTWSGIGCSAGLAAASFFADTPAQIEFMVKAGIFCGVVAGLAAFIHDAVRRNM